MEQHCARAGEEAMRLIVKHVHTLRLHLDSVRNEDVEGIHDMRVASRRLRAGLKEFAFLFETGPRKRFLGPVRSATRSLGVPRELDVTLGLVASWSAHLGEAPGDAIRGVERWLQAQRADSAGSCQEAVARIEAPEFEQSLTALFESYRPTPHCHLETGARNLGKQLTKLGKLYGLWLGEPREKRLHEVRILFKKLRYTSELYAPAYGRGMGKFIKRLKEAQEALGQWNDQRILGEYLSRVRDHAESPASEGLWLFSEAVDRRAAGLLERFKSSAGQFFSPSAQESMVALLAHPVQTCCR